MFPAALCLEMLYDIGLRAFFENVLNPMVLAALYSELVQQNICFGTLLSGVLLTFYFSNIGKP